VRLVPLALLLLAACGGEGPAPAAPPHPRRIVSLLPALTETAIALGAGDRLVGCTEYCPAPPSVARVGWSGPSAIEEILRLEPDLVLRQRVRTAEDPLKEALERAGVAVATAPTETIDDARGLLAAVGAAIGEPEAAARLLRAFDAEMAAIAEEVRGLGRPSVLFVFGRDAGAAANLFAAGPGSFLDALIARAGGRNAIADWKDAYASVPLEEVIRRAPDVIVDNVPPERDREAALRAWEVVRRAAPGVRVEPVLGNDLLVPGPRLPSSIRSLKALIHGRP